MLNNMSIRVKLLVAFLAISIIPFAVIGYLAVTTSNQALSKLAFEKLENLREVKKTQIETFFQERRQNMGALIESVTVLKQAAFDQMRSVQDVQQAQVEDAIQQWLKDVTVLSRESSLQQLSNFEMLLDGKGGVKLDTFAMYEAQYFGDSLKQFIAEYQYADLLLITANGNVVYTVNRDSDLGQNVLTGTLQDSSLATCFKKGLEGVTIQDFAPYPPSANQYMAFVAAPVVSQLLKKPVGVVALKIYKHRLNTIVRHREGLGTAGETYLVAQQAGQAVLWSDQAFRAGQMGDAAVGFEVEQVLAGKSGELVKKGPSGFMEIIRYTPLHLPGLSWGLIAVMSLEEVITPKRADNAADYFARFIQQYGYSDLALIHPDGTVFYSVKHAADYGQNLFEGDYQNTELTRSVRAAFTTKSLTFSDVQPYHAADGQPVAFMAQPVLNQDEVELMVAVQIPLAAINAMMQTRAGMGRTGEAYLVGQDQLLRSDSYIEPEQYSVTASFAAAENHRIKTPASQAALAGQQGTMLTRNYLGKDVLSAYTPVKVGETTWALLAEIEQAEALAPVKALTWFMGGMIGIIGGGVIILAFGITTVIMRPIKQVAQILKNVSVGKILSKQMEQDVAQKYVTRRDEIGIMSQAVVEMQTSIQAVLNETNRLIQAVQHGRLDIRGHTAQFAGDWQTLIDGINTVIEAFAVPIAVTAVALDQLAKGVIPNKMAQEYQGEFNTINTNLNLLIDATELTTRVAENIADGDLSMQVQERSANDRLMIALNAMTARLNGFLVEMDSLVKAVQQGRLDLRGETGMFAGGWRDLAMGVNALIDAFVTPITMAAAAIDRIAKGDIPEPLTATYQGDFNTIITNLNALIVASRQITHLAEQIAEGDLTVVVHERSSQDTLMQALDMMVTQLQQVVGNVQTVANQVALGSEDLISSSVKMSESVSQQASATEEVSASMEEMASNIRQNADNARETEKIALQAAEYAEEGGQVVAETVVAMQQIAEKILIIQDIATQTRLLSLNATIEAARAQDYGRAFSVVAAEVRKLSDTTKKAAEEISQLATSSLDISRKAGEMLTTLVPSIRKTAELVQEISAASVEQSSGTEHINNAVQQLDQGTQHNSAISEELATAAEELSAQAQQLQDTVRFFKMNQSAARNSAEHTTPAMLPATARAGRSNPTIMGPRKTRPTHNRPDRIYDQASIDLNTPQQTQDAQDDEFERY